MNLLLFAAARDLAGAAVLPVELAEDAVVADLKAAIRRERPAMAPLLPSLLIAVDGQYARDDAPIPTGAEVAAFPPVSGGAVTDSKPEVSEYR